MFLNIQLALTFIANNWAQVLECKPEDIIFEKSNKIVTTVNQTESNYEIVYNILSPDKKFLETIVIIRKPSAHGYECHRVSEQGIACSTPM